MSHNVALSFEDGVTRFITVNPHETVADASYRARINIPLDCRDGACGTCKSYCESGTFDPGDYIDDALTDDELDDGYCLPCQMMPESDLILQIPITSDVAKTAPAQHAATITDVTRLSDSTIGVTMSMEDRSALAFLPGQYVNVGVPGTEEQRSYSFANATDSDELTFLVRNTPGGVMTTYLTDRAEIGDQVELTGPMGSFFLREASRPLLLLAGGTGLAPIMSMLHALSTDASRNVQLLYGVTRPEDLVGTDELDQFVGSGLDLAYKTVVADADSGHEHTGFVTDHLTADLLNDGDIDVYLCGPPPMVDAVRDHLDSLGVTPVNFYFEKFTPAVGVSEGEVDTETVTVTEIDETRSRTRTTGPGIDSGAETYSLAADVDAQFDARMALELGSLELTIGRLGDEQLTEFRTLAEEANKYIEGSEFIDAEKFTSNNNQFHEFLFRCTGNDSLLNAYRGLEVVQHMNAILPTSSWVSEHIVREHLEIVEAFERNDRDAARYLVRAHSQHAKDTMRAALDEMEQDA